MKGAKVTLIHRWPDGAALSCEVKVATSYPDALSEARSQAELLFREALDVTAEADEAAGGS